MIGSMMMRATTITAKIILPIMRIFFFIICFLRLLADSANSSALSLRSNASFSMDDNWAFLFIT